jgi:putative ABC transport system permease protein
MTIRQIPDCAARNVLFAYRTLRRHPAAYFFAIAVLAGGIGMCTAIFSVFQAVLLKPLPFRQQSSLRVIWKTDPKSTAPVFELSYPEFLDLQRDVKAFESIAVMPTTLYGYGYLLQDGVHDSKQIESSRVSHDFFRTLGVKPMLGRDFDARDEHVGSARVVILSNWLWRNQFHADRSIIGRQITLSGEGYSVIGVMNPAVDFPRGVGLWTPMGVNARTVTNRHNYFMQAIARVKPGYADEDVKAEVNTVFKRLQRQYPQLYSPTQRASIIPLAQYWVGASRSALMLSLAASLLLLATGGISASHLFLSRTLARHQEISTRASLGATPRQIVTQFMVEGLMFSLCAGGLGLGIALGLIKLLVSLAPADLPRITDADLNWQVLSFAMAVSVITGLACSVSPAVVASKANLEAVLRQTGDRLSSGLSGKRLQSLFTITQTAITVVLLAVSALVAISVHRMLSANTGFTNRNAITMELRLHGPEFNDDDSIQRFYTRLLERLRQSPQIAGAGGVLLRPLEGTIGWDMPYLFEGNDAERPATTPVANFEVVTPGYFQAIGTPLLEGRDFTLQDKKGSEQAVIIGRSLASRYRKIGRNPIGQRIALARHSDVPLWTVVGVVGDTRYRSVTTSNDDIYVSYLQTSIPVSYLVVNGKSSVQETLGIVRREIAAVDATQTIAGITTVSGLIDRNTARQRFDMTLLLTFGFGALLLAGAGIYAVIAESVAVRSKEIGIRMAVGADRIRLLSWLIRGTIRLVIAGETVGLLCVAALAPTLSPMLYNFSPLDASALISVSLFLFIVAIASATIPAWAATREEPGVILR